MHAHSLFSSQTFAVIQNPIFANGDMKTLLINLSTLISYFVKMAKAPMSIYVFIVSPLRRTRLALPQTCLQSKKLECKKNSRILMKNSLSVVPEFRTLGGSPCIYFNNILLRAVNFSFFRFCYTHNVLLLLCDICNT